MGTEEPLKQRIHLVKIKIIFSRTMGRKQSSLHWKASRKKERLGREREEVKSDDSSQRAPLH